MKNLLTVFLLLALAGAAFGQQETEPPVEGWRKNTTTKESEFSTKIIVLGPSNVVGSLYGRESAWVQLNAFIDKQTGAVSHWLVYDEIYNARNAHRWSHAATDKAVELKTVRLKLKVSSCGRGTCLYDESVGVVIPNEMMTSAATERIRIQLTGDGINYIAYVEPAQAKDQIEAAEFYRSKHMGK